jgi:hypothetical protein
MNSARRSVRFLCASLAMLSGGCLEIETTTTVNTDGTFVRAIESKSEDSAKVVDASPLFLTDSTWTVLRRKIHDTSWVTTITREFRDRNALAEGLRGEPGRSLEVRVGLEKRFQWFTTEYAYSETLLCYNQIKAVPITRYLTPAERDFWLGHEKKDGKNSFNSTEDSLSYERIERIGPEWDARNKFEEFFALFLEGVRELNDPGLTVQMVSATKDTLYTHCGPIVGQSTDLPDSLADEMENVLASPLVKKVFIASYDRFQEFERKMKFSFDLLTAPYKKATIVMPGLITSTNAESIEGNRLEWNDFMAKGYVTDYAMWARSRVVNWWAVIVTGGVVILLTAILLVGVLRRKRGVV